MTTNNFQGLSNICISNDTIIERMFESAYDTLCKLYPTYQLDATDCYLINVYNDKLLETDQSINFEVGCTPEGPAVRNIATQEIIPIHINSHNWY